MLLLCFLKPTSFCCPNYPLGCDVRRRFVLLVTVVLWTSHGQWMYKEYSYRVNSASTSIHNDLSNNVSGASSECSTPHDPEFQAVSWYHQTTRVFFIILQREGIEKDKTVVNSCNKLLSGFRWLTEPAAESISNCLSDMISSINSLMYLSLSDLFISTFSEMASRTHFGTDAAAERANDGELWRKCLTERKFSYMHFIKYSTYLASLVNKCTSVEMVDYMILIR